jgi:integrase
MRERRPGTWELIASLGRDPLDGRYRKVSRTVNGSKREAQRALAELVTEVTAGRESGANATVSDLLAQWLDVAGDQLSPTTLRTYRQIVRTRLGPAIGTVRVRKLRAQQLDQMYRALMHDEQLSPTTVRQVHSVIRRALAQAVRWGWVPVNVAANATPPRARRPQLGPPLMADVQKILAAAFEENTEFGVFLHVVAASGVRRGEACALRWRDVDLETGIAIVSRSIISTGRGGYLEKDTKTHAIRKLALDGDTISILDAHQHRMSTRAAACGGKLADGAFVFSESADGARPWHPDTPTARFVRLRHNVGLDNVRLHDLRHMHATQLLAAGVPVRTVSGRLGHANAATTLNVYAHFLEASDRQAATVMGALLRPT